MIPNANTPGNSSWWSGSPLSVITVAGIVIGIYARFKGLSTWPFGVDEFYVSRSIDYVMRTGLPEFPCGGYYTRGLLYQYVVAGLRLAGLEPELAGRLVTSITSLAVLPGAYLLARRLHSKVVGLLVVTVLAISVWEIEMARFARMYAPFQAVFVWYVLYFLRYTVDRQRSALLGMISLSILGVLIWEGGALMGLANLLPPFINHDRGRLRRCDWRYLAGMLLLFLMLYSAVAIDLRGYSGDPAYIGVDESDRLIGTEVNGYALWGIPSWYGGWILLSLIPLALSLASLRWLWSLRGRWLAAAGLALVLATALMHQFVGSISILVLLLLTRLIDGRELRERGARWFLAALVSCTLFWLIFGIFSMDSLATLSSELAGFPYILESIIKPWGRTVPLLSVLLFVALCALTWRTIIGQEEQTTLMSALLVLVLTLTLAIATSDTPREETRYSFFLYPVILTLAFVAIALACDSLVNNKGRAVTATIMASLLGFFVSEDFQPNHLAQIDSRDANFRIDMPKDRALHYYSRSDFRGLAKWLETKVQDEDIVVTGLSALAQYSNDIDYFFLEKEDPLYRQYACENGTIQRWTNLPLIYTSDALDAIVSSGQRVIVLLYPSRAKRLKLEAAARGWQMLELTLPIPGIGYVLILNPN